MDLYQCEEHVALLSGPALDSLQKESYGGVIQQPQGCTFLEYHFLIWCTPGVCVKQAKRHMDANHGSYTPC
jgi:hypothetical protein